MYLGDNVLLEGVRRSSTEFERTRPDAQIFLARVPEPEHFGVVDARGRQRVVRLVEKPTEFVSDLALVGVYLFDDSILEACATLEPSWRGEYEITEAIQWLIDHGKTVRAEMVTAGGRTPDGPRTCWRRTGCLLCGSVDGESTRPVSTASWSAPDAQVSDPQLHRPRCDRPRLPSSTDSVDRPRRLPGSAGARDRQHDPRLDRDGRGARSSGVGPRALDPRPQRRGPPSGPAATPIGSSSATRACRGRLIVAHRAVTPVPPSGPADGRGWGLHRGARAASAGPPCRRTGSSPGTWTSRPGPAGAPVRRMVARPLRACLADPLPRVRTGVVARRPPARGVARGGLRRLFVATNFLPPPTASRAGGARGARPRVRDDARDRAAPRRAVAPIVRPLAAPMQRASSCRATRRASSCSRTTSRPRQGRRRPARHGRRRVLAGAPPEVEAVRAALRHRRPLRRCSSAESSRGRTSSGWCTPSAWSRRTDVSLVIAGGPVRWAAGVRGAGRRGDRGAAGRRCERACPHAGYVEHVDVVALMSGAELLAYPSRYEGFGFPVLEGFAADVPVLTSNDSSLPEVAGDAAVLVDPEDPRRSPRALRELLEDRTSATSCAPRARPASRRSRGRLCPGDRGRRCAVRRSTPARLRRTGVRRPYDRRPRPGHRWRRLHRLPSGGCAARASRIDASPCSTGCRRAAPRQPRAARRRSAPHVRARRRERRRSRARRWWAAPTRWSTPPPSRTSTGRSTRRADFLQTNVMGTQVGARGGPRPRASGC